jgi:hypothetical protein
VEQLERHPGLLDVETDAPRRCPCDPTEFIEEHDEF